MSERRKFAIVYTGPGENAPIGYVYADNAVEAVVMASRVMSEIIITRFLSVREELSAGRTNP